MVADPFLLRRLKAQIRSLRADIDPKVLGWAQEKLLAADILGEGAPRASTPPAAEAYDKDAAKKTIELFLSGRMSDPRFLQKLRDKLKSEGAEPPAGRKK
jgi:hypothetical protein